MFSNSLERQPQIFFQLLLSIRMKLDLKEMKNVTSLKLSFTPITAEQGYTS